MEIVTRNSLAYRILGLYRAQHKNTDNLDIRLIKSWIDSTRALLVKQKMDKSILGIDDTFIQTLAPNGNPVQLEEIDSSLLSSIPSKRYMKRTNIDIPKVLFIRGGVPAFTRIGPVDRLEYKFKPVSYETALISGFGKFNSKDIYCFYLDKRIYLMSRDLNYFKHIEYIDVKGVFHYPSEVDALNDASHDDDSPYPITPAMIEDMESIIVKTKFSFVLTGLADTVANERDDLLNVQLQQRR
jgi:hypothetical protein